jgi:hypothetical protein
MIAWGRLRGQQVEEVLAEAGEDDAEVIPSLTKYFAPSFHICCSMFVLQCPLVM